MGLFQAFRPNGIGEIVRLREYPGADEFQARLGSVVCGSSILGSKGCMKDAYFIVRKPPVIDAELARDVATKFVQSALLLARTSGLVGTDTLKTTPSVRILEGKPPKHPRNREEQVLLLRLFSDDLPAHISSLFSDEPLGNALEESLYFVACDAWLQTFLGATFERCRPRTTQCLLKLFSTVATRNQISYLL